MCEVFWQYVNKVSNTVRERLRIGILVSGSVKARRDLRPPSCWKWWGWSPGGLSDLFKVTHRASKAQGVRPGSPGSQAEWGSDLETSMEQSCWPLPTVPPQQTSWKSGPSPTHELPSRAVGTIHTHITGPPWPEDHPALEDRWVPKPWSFPSGSLVPGRLTTHGWPCLLRAQTR